MKHIASITTLTLVAAASMADAAAPAVAPAAAWSQSANLAITSNYIWRGISQTDNGLAIQGGFDVAHTSGLSAGVWGSNVQDNEGDYLNGVEFDFYANYGFKVSNVDLSVGYIAYYYQSFTNLNFSEINVAATYAGVTAKVSKEISNSSDGSGFTDHGYYYELGYTYSIPAVKGLDLGLHYGWAEYANVTEEDYSVSLTYPVAGFAATLAYSNAPGASNRTWNTSNSINKDIFAVTLKKTF
jgi:uncharacterized protein (TIGR02001 family)